ncbi:hypothetical protein C8R44DRAFT_941820 [Mycena epipterygia]|nr:hypothetical protein C8R44DRAFT_941820 [Mycena epipterygia]
MSQTFCEIRTRETLSAGSVDSHPQVHFDDRIRSQLEIYTASTPEYARGRQSKLKIAQNTPESAAVIRSVSDYARERQSSSERHSGLLWAAPATLNDSGENSQEGGFYSGSLATLGTLECSGVGPGFADGPPARPPAHYSRKEAAKSMVVSTGKGGWGRSAMKRELSSSGCELSNLEAEPESKLAKPSQKRAVPPAVMLFFWLTIRRHRSCVIGIYLTEQLIELDLTGTTSHPSLARFSNQLTQRSPPYLLDTNPAAGGAWEDTLPHLDMRERFRSNALRLRDVATPGCGQSGCPYLGILGV